jgi:RNA polymerase sigma-70 factor (ECF subfamily)
LAAGNSPGSDGEPQPRPETGRAARFQAEILPHLDAAVNLAWWLTGNRTDAEDIVQEAVLRAFKYFDRFSGREAKPWLLAIVRNTCSTWIGRNRPRQLVLVADADAEAERRNAESAAAAPSPERQSEQRELGQAIDRAMAALPVEFREVMILREVQELPYKEIAAIIDAPIGTVMSRLARARKLLQARLKEAVR